MPNISVSTLSAKIELTGAVVEIEQIKFDALDVESRSPARQHVEQHLDQRCDAVGTRQIARAFDKRLERQILVCEGL